MSNTLAKSVVTVAMLVFPLLAFAGLEDEAATLPSAVTIGGAEIFNLGSSLVVVILAIVVVGWLYSRMQGVSHRGGDLINIVASRPLGPKERILLIEIADQQLLVGMTASQVQTLHVFEQPIATAMPSSEPIGFAQRLRAAAKEMAK